MNGVTYAKTQLEGAFGLLGACAGGMDDAQYNWKPAGTANVAAKSHVHALTSSDFFINGIARSGADLVWASFAPANGLPANPMQIWTYEQPIPFAPMQDYAKQVQQSVLDYVATLSDDDLDRELETNFFGKKPISFLLQLAVNHSVGHGGDIAAVKGIQGLKGLPF
jgi:hypothetical protein